jgi:hypothetical protein
MASNFIEKGMNDLKKVQPGTETQVTGLTFDFSGLFPGPSGEWSLKG